MPAEAVPGIAGILETSVYVDDLAQAHGFYRDVIGLDCVLDTPRMKTFAVAPRQVLLVFQRGATREDIHTGGGVVPGHHSVGPSHFAFAVEHADIEGWSARLAAAGIKVIGRVRWPRGGRSLYFNDPDGNVLEMATPGLWPSSEGMSGIDRTPSRE